ncbi:MAG: hypothetical protein ACI8TQ_000648, partial [Planctomycetota bacterium]
TPTPTSTTKEAEDGEEDEVEKEVDKSSLEFILSDQFGWLFDYEIEEPEYDKPISGRKKLDGRHRSWIAQNGAYEVWIDAFEFELTDAKLVLIYTISEKVSKKWKRTFKSSAKSVEEVERERSLKFEKGGTYQDILAYHSELVSRTPGWTVLPTPSKRYLIKTSSTNKKFVDEVIERLELSRDLFERDFPPEQPITDVSVVRICGTEKEFHSYGKTRRGVGGWFSPSSAELVIFDYRETDRNATYSVMSHEAFHQYCHYLFGRSEAHRWFDEGHGDYYGGVRFNLGKAKVTKKMPGGFNRLPVIKSMLQSDDQAPLAQHLYFDHAEWQSQGPSGVSCYAQSWSIIYMLRRGALGELPRKMWEPEYAEILPNYMRTLSQGFREAYEQLTILRKAEASEDGRELTPDELEFDSEDLEEETREEIWKVAMAESWGKIDLEAFEEHWLSFVRKQL